MYGESLILFLLAMSLPDNGYGITRPLKQASRDARVIDKPAAPDRCAFRIETTLESMRRNSFANTITSSSPHSTTLDFAGYTLHKPLRTAPYDMYVTSMHVRMPGKTGWYRVDRCHFDPVNTSLETQLLFKDLTISGVVKLYEESAVLRAPVQPPSADGCNMTLRLRRAGLGITAYPRHAPRGGVLDITMLSRFMEPDFLSMYAYGCQLPRLNPNRESGVDDGSSAPERRQNSDFTQEVEDVFVRGIQSLLVTYMEKQLQPALTDTLMMNMGYTVSYGR
uniref:Uncharacterized protein n=1 Tax=Timema tahoe TaxID=61484 RepID=A0A7R9IQC0_9NEOP|nr:unnamed protein product [Timema tahoe]